MMISPPKQKPALNRPFGRRTWGFTLVEILIVVGIMVLVMMLALPAITSIQRGRTLSRAAQGIVDLLEQSRAFAMANNTYVWVGFVQEGDTLIVGTIASKSGAADPSAEVIQIGRLVRYENVRLVSAPDPQSRPDGNTAVQLTSVDDSTLKFNLGPATKPINFGPQVVSWNSRGEARIDSRHLYQKMEIGIQSSLNGQVRYPTDYAAIQIGGLSGATQLYRP